MEDFLVIDIETVPACADFEKLDKEWQELWSEKVLKTNPDANVLEQYRLRAGVMAEFAKIVCISIAEVDVRNNFSIQVKSYYETNEEQLLKNFINDLQVLFAKKKQVKFAGHNIREFDLPFICRRLLAHKIGIPEFLNFQHKKPWEVDIVDTFQLWRFGDYKNFTSLKLLAKVLNVKSSKDDMDGSMVAPLYWEDNPLLQEMNMMKIVQYCEGDVITTAEIIKRFFSTNRSTINE